MGKPYENYSEVDQRLIDLVALEYVNATERAHNYINTQGGKPEDAKNYEVIGSFRSEIIEQVDSQFGLDYKNPPEGSRAERLERVKNAIAENSGEEEIATIRQLAINVIVNHQIPTQRLQGVDSLKGTDGLIINRGSMVTNAKINELSAAAETVRKNVFDKEEDWFRDRPAKDATGAVKPVADDPSQNTVDPKQEQKPDPLEALLVAVAYIDMKARPPTRTAFSYEKLATAVETAGPSGSFKRIPVDKYYDRNGEARSGTDFQELVDTAMGQVGNNMDPSVVHELALGLRNKLNIPQTSNTLERDEITAMIDKLFTLPVSPIGNVKKTVMEKAGQLSAPSDTPDPLHVSLAIETTRQQGR